MSNFKQARRAIRRHNQFRVIRNRSTRPVPARDPWNHAHDIRSRDHLRLAKADLQDVMVPQAPAVAFVAEAAPRVRRWIKDYTRYHCHKGQVSWVHVRGYWRQIS